MELKVIDYETAKLAKEVGFDWDSLYYYDYENPPNIYELQYYHFDRNYDEYEGYPEDVQYFAPTQELLRQFLRTEHNIHIQMGLQDRMNPQMNRGFEFQGYCPILIIFYESGSLQQYSELPIKPNSSYEEALEAGLKKALNYLLNQK